MSPSLMRTTKRDGSLFFVLLVRTRHQVTPGANGTREMTASKKQLARADVDYVPRIIRLADAVIIRPGTRVPLRLAGLMPITTRQMLLQHLKSIVSDDRLTQVLDELVTDAEAAAIKWAVAGSSRSGVGLVPVGANKRLLLALRELTAVKTELDRRRGPKENLLLNLDPRLPSLIDQFDGRMSQHLAESVEPIGRGAPLVSVRRTYEFARDVRKSWVERVGRPASRGDKIGNTAQFYIDLLPHISCSLPVTLTSTSAIVPANLKLLKNDFAEAINAAIKRPHVRDRKSPD